jgi:hypothetical protein
MRFPGIIALAIISFGLLGQPAMADKRVARVMGNSAYQKVNRLANPGNDSSAMSETLKNAGFDVVELKRDLNESEMRRALRDFSDTVRDADVAIVYFAGHGIEIDGTNDAQASGQIFCNLQGCRPIRPGCRLAHSFTGRGGPK